MIVDDRRVIVRIRAFILRATWINPCALDGFGKLE
jgi:hypothetical protein